ncbi:MAG: 16S rRNA (cytosine(967)-C(5))-methyltransferase RsmB [Clostridia bacterium]|nr:16S rRNA (cytosine(967)-C(5))-methyltransferase RsmB [Clostridia bacterium]
MKNPRQIAFEALLKIHKEGAYSNLVLDGMLSANSELDERDRAFISNLVYGSLDHMIIIDYNLSLYLNQPSKKLKPELHMILVLGAYQILFMDKVPDHAAVSESVQLAKVNKSAFAASLVNAVLRRVADNGLKYPENTGNSAEYLSIRYSCPQWLVELWIDSYGFANAEGLASKALEAPGVTVRVNNLRTTPDDLMWKLAEEGVVAQSLPAPENAMKLTLSGAVDNLSAYKEGLFHVQDISSQLCCLALDPKETDTIFDMCAAPGGKSFTIAEMMGGKGTVKSFDIYQSRVELIKSGAKRLGLGNVRTYFSDAQFFNSDYGQADKILCDVPCSGLGIIRRKPEIRFKNKSEIDKLPEIQFRILSNSVKYLKPGGRLVYSTCTLNPEENDAVCNRFLAEHPEFAAVQFLPQVRRYGENDRYLTLMPHLHGTDGFFIAVFEKTD